MIRFDGSSWEFAGSGNFFFFFLQPRVVAGATQMTFAGIAPHATYTHRTVYFT